MVVKILRLTCLRGLGTVLLGILVFWFTFTIYNETLDSLEIVENIDESLNHLEQDDPLLVEAVRERHLIAPSTEPYNWGKYGQAPHERKLSGQFNQAKFVEGMFQVGQNLDNGFFIEAGAWDGVHLSNTLLFELRHNWTGLLVEPNPEAFKSLKEKQRKAWLLPRCFSTKTRPEVVEFQTAGVFGGIINKGKIKGLYEHSWEEPEIIKKYSGVQVENRWRTIRIQCFPLYTVLLALGNPTVHYFSLDIEGSELQVLKTIPLHKVDIKIFDIEMNHLGETFDGSADDLREYLKTNGYSVFKRIKIDDIFVKRGFEVKSREDIMSNMAT